MRALPAGIDVRILTPADAAVLDAVHVDVFDETIRADGVRAFFDDPRSILAVALDADVVIGMVTAYTYAHPDKPLQLWVNELGVAEPFRRRGIARALMQLVLDRGRELGCVEAWVATEVDNTPARAVYASLGGVEAPDPAVVYTFPLDAPEAD